ncbi:MAG: thiamine-binding protein [Ornithinimicrobium sp.]|uniref:thiamine-binding protein n=1 Tax=Ornithinimicrobium sp. TaxID=1977084 RepID=UPI003D9ADA71
MLFAFSISPSGSADSDSDGSVSRAVADAVRVVRASGLPHETTSMFSTIEGEWDECMTVIKDACDVVAQHSDRVGLVLKADLRPGYTGQLTSKVDRVEERLRDSDG